MLFRAQALLVDIDGTLVDSTAAVVASWTAWAGTHQLDAGEILRVCHGRRTQDTVAMFVPAERVPSATRHVEELELAALYDVTALAGADLLLRDLPSNRWAGVTSGSRRLMRARLAAAGLPVPDVLIAAEDVSEGKPDPEGYLAASAALGCDIVRCVVIEDSPAGIAAGRAAGAQTVAVATSHDAAELTSADTVVQDLTRCTVELRADHLVLTAELNYQLRIGALSRPADRCAVIPTWVAEVKVSTGGWWRHARLPSVGRSTPAWQSTRSARSAKLRP